MKPAPTVPPPAISGLPRHGGGARAAARRGPLAWRPAVLGLACLLPLLEGGCFLFPRAKPVPPTLVLTQPIILQPPPMAAEPAPPAPAAAPKVIVLVPEPAPKLRPAPRRRRPEAKAAKAPPAPPAVLTGPAPQLTSELTPEETTRYRRTAGEWLDAASHDLALTARWRLNDEQAATRAQANEYIRQARTALGQGAVVRAQNLAHKALVLAEALLGG